jgi:hypothetical protein
VSDQSTTRYEIRATLAAALIQSGYVDMKTVALSGSSADAHSAKIKNLKEAVDVLMTEVVYQ